MRTRGIAVAAVLISSVVAGCTTGDDDAEKDSAGKSSKESVAQPSRNKGGGSIMFVQTVQGGTLRRSDAGGLRLVLQGVDKHAVFFSDRPARDSGVITTEELLPLLYGPRTPPPNAALVVNDGASAGIAPLELVSGKYEPRTGTLTYEARPLRNLTRPRLKHFEDRIDKTPPQKFGRASLFIDNVVGESCHGTFINSTSKNVKLTERSKNPKDSWGIEPLVNFNIGPNGDKLTWRSDAPAFRGCENDLTFQVLDDSGSTIATIETHLQKNFAVGFNGGYSCRSSSDRFKCSQVSADRDPQGLDLDVTWSLGGT